MAVTGSPSAVADRTKPAVVFSDLDGTLIHYPVPIPDKEGLLILPPSSTGKQGITSTAILKAFDQLRGAGLHVVMITGARTFTLLQRLPFLPSSDAYASENGGRIFYPISPISVAEAGVDGLVEDLEWRKVHESVAGPPSQDALSPAERQGILWDWYRHLQADGWKLDANSYSTAFRLQVVKGTKTLEDLTAVIAARPQELACTFNVGCADFYPTTSGKEHAAAYLMKRFGAVADNSVFLCDDDNDITLANMLGKAFCPSIGSMTMQLNIQQHEEHYMVATRPHVEGTEEALHAVLQHYGINSSPDGTTSSPAEAAAASPPS